MAAIPQAGSACLWFIPGGGMPAGLPRSEDYLPIAVGMAVAVPASVADRSWTQVPPSHDHIDCDTCFDVKGL